MPSEPRRRGRGCLVTLGVVAFLLIAVVLLRQPIGRGAVGIAAGMLGRSLSGRVEYEKITGDIFGSPVIEGLRVYWNGDSLRVARLSVRYDPFGFLFGRIPISELEVERPELFLSQLPQGDTVVGADTAPPRPLKLPRLNLTRLAVTDGRIFLADTLRVDSLTFVASGRSEQASARLDLLTLRGRAVREGVTLREMSARCRLTPQTLLLDKLEARTDRSRMAGQVHLALRDGVVDLELTGLTVDLSEFTEIKGLFRARGKARLAGAERSATLDYTLNGLDLGAVRLPNLTGTLRFSDPLLRLEVSGHDPDRGGFDLTGSFDYRQMSFEAHGRLRGLRAARWQAGLPDIELDADLAAGGVWPDSISVEAGGRSASLGIDTFRIAGRRIGERYEVERFDAIGPVGRVWVAGTWGPAGRVRAECILDSVNIAPLARLAGIDASGVVNGVVHGAGTLDSIDVSGGIRLDDFQTGDVSLGVAVLGLDVAVGRELHGRLALGAERAKWGGQEVDAIQLTLLGTDFDLRADRPQGRLTARGGYAVGRNALHLDVAVFEYAGVAETLSLAEPFTIDLDRDSLAVRGLRYDVADGVVELDAVRVGSGRPEIALNARGVNLGKLQKLLRLDQELSGTIDLSVTGRDTLDCRLTATDLQYPGVGMAFEHARLAVRYAGSRVSLDTVRLVHQVDTTTASGWVEFATDSGFRVTDVDLVAHLANPGAWPLFFLKGIVDLREGLIYGDLSVKGDLLTPELSGRVRVSLGRLWVPSVSTLVERVTAEITATGGRVNVQKVSGKAGSGVVTAEGFVQLGREWSVDTLAFVIRPEDAVLRPLPEVYAVASGNILLTLAKNRPLSIEGTIDAKEALVTYGFGLETTPSVPSEPVTDSVVYDIRIKGERGIWLRNRMADIELSVDLAIKKTMTGETWAGQLETRQGNIYYLDNTLRVTQGDIRFENISTLNPELAIVAELPVHSQNGDAGAMPDRILLTVGGTLNKPTFTFSSEPIAWDENDIITYLSLNVTPAELDAFDNREVVARYLSGRLLGFAQTQFSKQVRQWLSVDALRFESEFTGGSGNKVTVGKYIGRDLYITYTQNFTGDLVPEFRVEYYLSRRNEIVGERNEDGRFSLRYQYRLRY